MLCDDDDDGSRLIKVEGHQTFDQKLKVFLLFSCLMGCFGRLDSRLSKMFDAGMLTTLAQRLV